MEVNGKIWRVNGISLPARLYCQMAAILPARLLRKAVEWIYGIK